MSTSAIDYRHCALKSAFVYLLLTAFTALFGAVYEIFSHGVYTYYMLYAFAFPLMLGVLPYVCIALFGNKKYPTSFASGLWNSGVAALTIGSVIQGVLVIYGTTNSLVIVYPVIGGLLLISAIVLHIVSKKDA